MIFHAPSSHALLTYTRLSIPAVAAAVAVSAAYLLAVTGTSAIVIPLLMEHGGLLG
ncbi:unnamed protein product [Haemonchus placei]|uniref:Amino acid permease n=1 Tax=Haemonchus placei TaxID=6290 RepID=A0A0N4W0I6_HAEPC|nr:unnamed protein product [Haemonchus placei]